MQAMQIHLSQSQDFLEIGRNVQGLNSPIDSENSFDSFLQNEMNDDKFQAKEGPPEYQKAESTQPSSETSSGQSSTDSNSDSNAQASNDDSLKESEATKNAKSEESRKESSEDAESKVSHAKSDENAHETKLGLANEGAVGIGESFAGVLTALEDAKKLAEDEETKGRLDALALSGTLDGKNQVLNEYGGLKAGEESLQASELTDGSKKSKQVLAEIPTISVLDERSVSSEGQADGNFVRSISYDGNGNATMDLSLNQNFNGMQTPQGAIINADGSVQQHTVSNAQQFGTMLSSELQSNSSELVKTGSIILKDGNQGTINLILHPEELGNVKIKLDISDNVLTGRITVASEEAYNAFKANMSSLKEAFDANGFDTAGFDLSWSGEDNAGDNQENDNKNPFGNRYDENIALVSDGEQRIQSIYGHEAYINVVA